MAAEMKVYIAYWEHKHGTDMSVHREYEGAKETLRQWAQGCLEEWSWEKLEEPKYIQWLQDLDGAVDNWHDIAAYEYMEVRGPFEVSQ